jgi:hypothetical protein
MTGARLIESEAQAAQRPASEPDAGGEQSRAGVDAVGVEQESLGRPARSEGRGTDDDP